MSICEKCNEEKKYGPAACRCIREARRKREKEAAEKRIEKFKEKIKKIKEPPPHLMSDGHKETEIATCLEECRDETLCLPEQKNINYKEDIFKILNELDKHFPHKLPDEENFLKWVESLGRRKLKDTLIKLAGEKHNAVQTLLDEGYVINRNGKWVKNIK